MTNPNDFQAYLQDDSAQPKRFFTEEPPPLPPPIQKAPIGFSPMERIELEGKAYRGLASGAQPWWVIISGWIMFGLPSIGIGIWAIAAADAALWGTAVIGIIILWILYRGTRAKLAAQKAIIQRQAKYRQQMGE